MGSTTTIYLVRHGQTEWNIQHRMQGHQDSPLTEMGIKQAQWLGESLQGEHLDVVLSSTSERAVMTAEIIVKGRGINIIKSKDLREIGLGTWEGKTQSDVREMYPKQYDYFWNDPEKFSVEGSETFSGVWERAINKLNGIIRGYQGSSILIVTHTVIVKLIMAYFEGRLLKDIWNPPYIYPACLSKVEITDNKPQIILHGDISHYREGLALG